MNRGKEANSRLETNLNMYICKFSKLLTKNVGAGDGTEHMEILIEWRDENEVPLVMLRTVLQDWKNSFGIF